MGWFSGLDGSPGGRTTWRMLGFYSVFDAFEVGRGSVFGVVRMRGRAIRAVTSSWPRGSARAAAVAPGLSWRTAVGAAAAATAGAGAAGIAGTIGAMRTDAGRTTGAVIMRTGAVRSGGMIGGTSGGMIATRTALGGETAGMEARAAAAASEAVALY